MATGSLGVSRVITSQRASSSLKYDYSVLSPPPCSLHHNRRTPFHVAKLERTIALNCRQASRGQPMDRYPWLSSDFSRRGMHRDLTNDSTWKSKDLTEGPPPMRHFSSQRWRHVARSSTSGESEEQASTPGESSGDAERLFSNVNISTMKHEPGSVSGSTLLVAGTTVGAGILALPAVTQDAGFLPSATACVGCWLYMVLTGLLVAEVNLNTMCSLGSGGVSLVSMAYRTLGNAGVRVSCGFYVLYHFPVMVAYVNRSSEIITNAVGYPLVAYLFIHYALLVAYVARSSELVSSSTGSPLWLSGTLFTAALGSLCYFGSQQTISIANGVLVTGILSSFAVLVALAAGGLEVDSLLRGNFAAVPSSIPIIALSFVYQNVVPVICSDLEGDRAKIRWSIVLGTGIPLLMFLVWDGVILGSIPFDPSGGNSRLSDPLAMLRSTNEVVGPVVEVFSFLAVATSYIGFVLGLTDFLSDWLKLPAGKNQALPFLLTLLPPLAFAITTPDIFFSALDFAGTYGVLVLFGILPAAMAWSERYTEPESALTLAPPLVPGGRVTLGIVIGLAGWIITSELWELVIK